MGWSGTEQALPLLNLIQGVLVLSHPVWAEKKEPPWGQVMKWQTDWIRWLHPNRAPKSVQYIPQTKPKWKLWATIALKNTWKAHDSALVSLRKPWLIDILHLFSVLLAQGPEHPSRYIVESLPPLGKTKMGGRHLGELRDLAVLLKQGLLTNVIGLHYSY